MYKLLILVYINYAAAALESRIVNGRDALPGEFGYIVSLQRHHHHRCGGSIIDQNNVITAAHCLGGDIFNYSIQYGVIKIVPNDVNVIQAGKEFIHEFYDPGDKSNDIAIIRLSSPIPLNSSNVTPIPLPTQGEEFQANTWARVAGWGTDDGVASEHLQTMITYIISMEECTNFYEWWFMHEQSQICTLNKRYQRGLCSGDSGSPLVKIINREKKLAGVASWVTTTNRVCGLNGLPNVFTKVSHYVNWIEEQVSNI